MSVLSRKMVAGTSHAVKTRRGDQVNVVRIRNLSVEINRAHRYTSEYSWEVPVSQDLDTDLCMRFLQHKRQHAPSTSFSSAQTSKGSLPISWTRPARAA